jgi:hypothetical protein
MESAIVKEGIPPSMELKPSMQSADLRDVVVRSFVRLFLVKRAFEMMRTPTHSHSLLSRLFVIDGGTRL